MFLSFTDCGELYGANFSQAKEGGQQGAALDGDSVALHPRQCAWSFGMTMNTGNNETATDTSKSTNRRQCALCGRKRILGIGWHQEDALVFCRRCWPNIDPAIEWFEARYAILHRCIGRELDQKPPLFTLLGREQSHVGVEDGEWLTDQVIQHLSLPRGDISFEFTPLKSSIAGTVESSGGKYQVKMSKDMEDNFRSVSAILIHELMHVYLNLHGIFYKTQEEYEEATDLACVLMGFGIPMINAKKAWRVDRVALGGEGIGGGTSYHIIGYLSEKQIGYSFATFLADRNITVDELQDKIDSQCLHSVTDGVALERAYHDRLTTKRKALALSGQKQTQREVCEFSCPACFQKLAVPKGTIRRVGVLKAECPKCHSVVHFDGDRIVKFIESLR